MPDGRWVFDSAGHVIGGESFGDTMLWMKPSKWEEHERTVKIQVTNEHLKVIARPKCMRIICNPLCEAIAEILQDQTPDVRYYAEQGKIYVKGIEFVLTPAVRRTMMAIFEGLEGEPFEVELPLGDFPTLKLIAASKK